MSGGHSRLSCDLRVGEVCVDSTDWELAKLRLWNSDAAHHQVRLPCD